MADEFDDEDDEPTPPERPSRAPLRITDSASRKRRRVLANAMGVPAMTEALQLLIGGQLAAEDIATIEALRRSDEIDPYVLAVNLAKAMDARNKQQKSGSKEMEQAVAKAVKDQEDRLKKLEGKASTASWIVKAVAGLALSGLAFLGKEYLLRSEQIVELVVQVRTLKETADRQETTITWLRSRHTTQKDNQ